MIIGESVFALLESGRAWRLFLNALPFGLRETYLPPGLKTKQIAVRKNLPARQNARENLARFASEIVTASPPNQSSTRQVTAARLLRILCSLESKLSFIYDPLCAGTEETVKQADVLTAKIDEREEIEDKVVEVEPGEAAIHGRARETTPELLRISEAATLGDVDRMTIDGWIRNPIPGFAACVEVINEERGDKRIRRDELPSVMDSRKGLPHYPSGRDSASAMTATTEWLSPPESDQSLRAIAIRYYGRDKPFSMKELMTMFGCSRWTIRRWCQ